MGPSDALLLALKNVLKSKGLTYSDLAKSLKLNETSVKRLMSGRTPITLNRIDQICEFAGVDFFELMKLARPEAQQEITQFSLEQEQAIAEDDDLFLCFYGLAKGLAVEDIVAKYRISLARAQKALHKLARINVVEVLLKDRVKFLVPRSVRWLEGGPLSQKYEKNMERDFLSHEFIAGHQFRKFVTFFPLSDRSKATATRKLRELASEIQSLSEVDMAVEKNLKSSATLLIGFREWTPAVLDKYLRS